MSYTLELKIVLKKGTLQGQEIYENLVQKLWFRPEKVHLDGVTFGIKPYRKKYLEYLKKIESNISLNIYKEFNLFDVDRLLITEPAHRHTNQTIILNFSKEKYDEVFNLIKPYIYSNKFVVGYCYEIEDHYFQSASNATAYRVKNIEPPTENAYIGEFGDEDICYDISNNPGRTTLVGHMWLTSSWSMWFGKEFYNYVSKDYLKNFTLAFEIKEMENDVLNIKLYADPMKAAIPENRRIQKLFRDYVKMDELIKNLE